MFIESKFQKRTQDRKTLEFCYTKDYRFNIQLALSITLVEQDKNFFLIKTISCETHDIRKVKYLNVICTWLWQLSRMSCVETGA